MKPFVSFDGKDEQGNRAEVRVQINQGVVSDIKDGDKGTSDIHFKVEGLKYAVHGWVGTDDPVYKAAVEAKKNNDLITFRIESQRKRKVDRSLPILELISTVDSARDNTTPILAGIENLLSSEAVTNPAEDSKYSGSATGRFVANSDDMDVPTPGATQTSTGDPKTLLSTLEAVSKESSVSNEVVAVVAGLALVAGAEASEIHAAIAGKDRRDTTQPEPRASFSMEAPAWKEFNSDGRFNLGSAAVASGVGTEVLVRRLVSTISSENVDNEKGLAVIGYFTGLVLAIADRVQVATYGDGFKADRGSASHTRVRGLVYDTIEHYYPLPLNSDLTVTDGRKETIDNWIASVGKLSVNRFKTAVQKSTDTSGFRGLSIPAGMLSGGSPASTAEAVRPASQVTAPSTPVSAGKPATPAAPVTPPAPATPQAPDSAPEPEEEYTEADENADTLVMHPQVPLDESVLVNGVLKPELAPDQELVDNVKELFEAAELPREDAIKLVRLLKYTFGPKFGKVTNIPAENLEGFLDFYVASGEDNFRDVLNQVSE